MDTRTGLQSITSPEGQGCLATREAIKVTPLGESTGVVYLICALLGTCPRLSGPLVYCPGQPQVPVLRLYQKRARGIKRRISVETRYALTPFNACRTASSSSLIHDVARNL
ncbi:hypothetical protein GE21DRAFT_7735 [Neurospora crassa]|uniref:Uncharacterized protein n=1 Tax=Neurospora crassa (strain ATCC 24698 / 74-OR23-1A / CBS 708.71 / DSM 1257 / FGSC 987) TaxID=367110 RepID=Q7S7W9_NEUCR|nr:hypothetical protein NCU01308 [Neurospora crassa OR74A]EAA32158.3 hypothetical protein NCU01308 [Neurospora crassa OR74A]KHE83503.1 hypothetical protein GE21DRAFT_7735 [Neurospora crassa]|eukprot:XP_961394.3 hypothetical protein NCU01308 [Neurospora crassa OR74A]